MTTTDTSVAPVPKAYYVTSPGPRDGHLVEYRFGTHDDAWRVKAPTLARAINLFRVGCPFPHQYSDGRLAEPDRVAGTSSYGRLVYLRSTPGAGVVVATVLDRSMAVVARIPVEDDGIEAALLEVQAHGSLATAGALVRATALTGLQAEPRASLDTRSLDLQRQMDALTAAKAQLALQVAELQAELARRMEQVWLIELYLGSKEQVVVLRQGVPAPVEEKITVRQATLCMDEEIAVHDWLNNPDRIGQFDCESLEDFDRWLVSDPAALDAICPWPKGIVALRPRRTEKDRPELAGSLGAALAKIELEEADKMTYLLVRNGENLYRLWIDVRLWPRLVPRADDLEAKSSFEDRSPASWDYERAEQKRKQVGAGLLAITGLLQRSTLLHPLPRADINAFNPLHVDEFFTIVYDDEGHNLLGDGRAHENLTWDSYHKWLKAQTDVGSRVIFRVPYQGSREDREIENRTNGRARVWPQNNAVYTIEEKLEKHWSHYEFKFKFLPGTTVYRRGEDGWVDEFERTRRVSFYCYRDEVVPLDCLSWRVLEHLIRDRGQREHYGRFFRLAFDFWEFAKAEAALERPFIDLVLTRAGVDLGNDVERARCERLTRWWKLKVKMTRTISTDEAKALRMIEAAFKRGDDHENDPEHLLLRSL